MAKVEKHSDVLHSDVNTSMKVEIIGDTIIFTDEAPAVTLGYPICELDELVEFVKDQLKKRTI